MPKMKSLRYIVAGLFAIGLFIGMSQVAFADTYVTVTGSPLNVRSSPEITPYNRIAQVSRGTRVRVIGVSGDFFRAFVPDVGYAYIAREWTEFYRTRGVVTAPATWVFDSPGACYGTPIAIAFADDYFTVVSYYGEWYGVLYNGELAFVEKQHMVTPYFIDIPPFRTSSDGGYSSNSSVVDEVIAKALRYLGTPYRWGGNGPHSFDCSGFVSYVLRPFGVTLPRRSRDMASSGTHVARSDIRAGDLVFFATAGGRTVSHVGLYIGNGQFIHSSSSRSGGVIISNFNSDYWRRTFVTARRVL